MSDDNLPTSHKGKIGSLPATLREEVNRRLHDGVVGREICDWLNSLPEVLVILDERWAEQPITPQNLSEWKAGGYQIWLRNRQKGEHLRKLTDWAYTLTDQVAVEKLTGAAQAIMAGNLLEVMETMDSEEAMGLIEALAGVTLSVDRTQKNEIARSKLELTKEQVALRRQEVALNREKFELLTVQKFLEWQGTPEARAIIESGKTQQVQTQELLNLFWGPAPDAKKEGANE